MTGVNNLTVASTPSEKDEVNNTKENSANSTSCPYAFTSGSAISSASSSPILSSAKNLTPTEALQLAKASCPAFKGSCPFRDVQDAESMKNALQTLPQSHFSLNRGEKPSERSGAGERDAVSVGDTSMTLADDIGATMKAALTHVHNVSQSLAKGTNDKELPKNSKNEPAKNFVIPGGCPLKQQFGNDATFASAMEKFSIWSQMSSLIEKADDANANAGQINRASLPSNLGATKTTEGGGMKRVRSLTSLSNALKEGTQESHSAAESVHFVKNFIQGNIDKTLYSILILNLFHLYKELEVLLDEHAPTCFPTLHFPKELARTEALKDDVDFFHGEGAITSCSKSQATLDYIRRIQYIAEKEPLLLLSHAYTRYLGDLSGGKILARKAKKALNLHGTESGLAFYQFDEIPSAKKFKDAYRQALDEMYLTDAEIERLVAEANVAFVLNMRIFEELDVLSGVYGAEVRSYESATGYYEDCIEKQSKSKDGAALDFPGHSVSSSGSKEVKGSASAQCPFAQLGAPNPHTKTPQKKANSMMEKVAMNQEGTLSKAYSNTTSGKEDGGRCPWPFVFLHDPKTGMKDFQTWIVIGLVLSFAWSYRENVLG